MAPIWVKSTAQKLHDSGIVSKITTWPAKITVRYTTTVLERYWFMPGPAPRGHILLDRDGGRVAKEIPIGTITDAGLLHDGRPPEYTYISIGQKAWKGATTIEQAIALQRFIKKTCETGYQGRVPANALNEDLASLRSYDQDRCVHHSPDGPVVDFYPKHKHRPGDLVLSHFFDLERAPRAARRGCVLAAIGRPRLVHRITRRLIRTGKRITSHNVLKPIRRKYGPQVLFCKAYAAFLQRVEAESVFDPHPETGTKALACALLGIPYYTRPNELFDQALRRGFAGFVGLDHRYLTAASAPDCTIVDGNLASFEYDAALDHAEASKRLVVYVPGSQKMESVAACAPDSVIDALMGYGTIGHFFIW